MIRKKSIFSIKLVRYLFLALVIKIIGFVVLFFLFFSPSHREKVTLDKVIEEMFSSEISKLNHEMK